MGSNSQEVRRKSHPAAAKNMCPYRIVENPNGSVFTIDFIPIDNLVDFGLC